ncbi:MAG: AAA family ATPase [Desulfurococcaceae archaeon]
MLFILVTGMPGAGKSIVTRVAAEMGLPVYNMGDVVREEVLKRYGHVTPELMISTSRELRKEYGEDVIAVRTLEKIKQKAKAVVIDGVRSLTEVEAFRKHGDVVIIAVHASPRTRFERLLARKRPGDPNTYEEFLKRDLVELGFGIGNVIALADHMLVNESIIEDIEKQAKELLDRLVKMRAQGDR